MTPAELKATLDEALGPLWFELVRQGTALERIAAAAEQILATAAPADGDDDGAEGCQHPVESRLALGTVGDGWQCVLCGFRQLPTPPAN